MITAILLITAIVAVCYILYLLIRALLARMAENDFLFTFRTEGEIKAIMKGDKCVRYLMAVDNYIIDPDDFDIFYGSIEKYRQHLLAQAAVRKNDPAFTEQKLKPDGSFKNGFEERLRKTNPSSDKEFSWFERNFGVVWIGFPPYRVFSYPFRWTKFMGESSGADKEKEEGYTVIERNGYSIIRREGTVNSLYFRYPNYVAEVKDAETGAGTAFGKEDANGKRLEKVQINMTLVFETVTTNPQKTLFRSTGLSSAGDWLVALVAELQGHLRSWVGQKTYDQLISVLETDKESTRILDDVIADINKKINPDYGQKITTIRIVSVELTDPSLQASVLAYFKAKQEADAAEEEKRKRVTLAEATKRESAATLLGEAEGLEAIVKAGGERMKIAEQLGKLRGVYAPGKEGGVFLNVPTEGPGENDSGKTPPKDKATGERKEEK